MQSGARCLHFRPADADTPVDPVQLLRQIKSEGANKIARHLYALGGRWSDVMNGIAKGGSNWLEVAQALHPGTNGGAAEELDEAIFFALAPSPVRGLQVLEDRQFQVDFICSSSVHVDYPVDQSRHFIQDRLRVLRRIADQKLQDTKAGCQKGLLQALRDLDRLGPDD